MNARGAPQHTPSKAAVASAPRVQSIERTTAKYESDRGDTMSESVVASEEQENVYMCDAVRTQLPILRAHNGGGPNLHIEATMDKNDCAHEPI